jgi:PKD repeat protein
MVRILSKYGFNRSSLFWFILLSLNILLFTVLSASAATQVLLEWAPNSEPNLAGYRVFYHEQNQSYDYTNAAWEGINNYTTIYDLDETKTYCFVVRAFDTEGFESGDSNEVCRELLIISNQSPTADAGPNQTVSEGQTVLLSGSNSTDPDDGIVSYHWVQIDEHIDEHAVNLSDPNAQQPTFTAPDVGLEGAALTFELTVVDQGGNQSKDECSVNVTWQNEPPLANAGPDQTVNEGDFVTLDGSASLDIDDGVGAYLWAQTGVQTGVQTVTLSNPTSSQPTFTAPPPGDGASLSFNLTVTDAGGLQSTDSCIVNVSRQNEPPTAVVSPEYMEVMEETLVTLDGSASKDSDDGIASYLWTQVDGDPVSFSNPTSAVTSFKSPKTDSLGKNLKFKLTVEDFGGLKSSTDSSIYVRQNENSTNSSPTVDFGYTINKTGVIFKDQSTDSDGFIVSWFWDFGDGKTSIEQNPKYLYSGYGTYTVTLTVIDDGGAITSQSKIITFATQTKGRRKKK